MATYSNSNQTIEPGHLVESRLSNHEWEVIEVVGDRVTICSVPGRITRRHRAETLTFVAAASPAQ